MIQKDNRNMENYFRTKKLVIWESISNIWLIIAIVLWGIQSIVVLLVRLSTDAIKAIEILVMMGASWLLLLGTFINLRKIKTILSEKGSLTAYQNKQLTNHILLLKYLSSGLAGLSLLGVCAGFWGEPIMSYNSGLVYLSMSLAGVLALGSTIWFYVHTVEIGRREQENSPIKLNL